MNAKLLLLFLLLGKILNVGFCDFLNFVVFDLLLFLFSFALLFCFSGNPPTFPSFSAGSGVSFNSIFPLMVSPRRRALSWSKGDA